MFRRVSRVRPYGATSLKTVNGVQCNVASRDTLVFQFPPDKVIDLSTLQLVFRYARLGGASNDTLPKDTECLIDELEVTLGDKVVNKISNYQQLMFMMSSYAMNADWVLGTQTFHRTWTNRRCATANVINWTFAMDTFLGFLGCGKIIDCRKMGRLTVRMRLSDSAAVNSSIPTNNWGMNDPYFRFEYFPNGSPSDERIVFDDFTSIRQAFPGYDSSTTLIVDGRRKLDYVLARQINVFNHDQKANAFDASVALTQRFVSSANNLANWDFTLNNTPYHSYEPIPEEGLMAMRTLFPKGVVNLNLSTNPTMDIFFRAWAAGVRLDLPQREDGQQWEVSFDTVAAAGASTTPQYTFLYAKTTSIVDCTSGSLQLLV